MMKYRFVLSFILLSTIVGLLVFSHISQNPISARAADIRLVTVPTVVHGFQKSTQLPDGDLYLVPNPMQLAINDAPAEGVETFTPNVVTFGADPVTFGALQNTSPQGLSLSAPSEKVTAVTCAESIWDGNLVIAGTSGTVGDKVRLFLQTTDGKPGPQSVRDRAGHSARQLDCLFRWCWRTRSAHGFADAGLAHDENVRTGRLFSRRRGNRTQGHLRHDLCGHHRHCRQSQCRSG